VDAFLLLYGVNEVEHPRRRTCRATLPPMVYGLCCSLVGLLAGISSAA
jgi:hypothetical protein